MPSDSASAISPSVPGKGSRAVILLWSGLAATLLWFFAGLQRFGPYKNESLAHWLASTWNKENSNYEHAWLVLIVMAWLVWRAIPSIKAAPARPSAAGLGWVVLGLVMFLAGARAIQDRVSMAALAPLLLGVFHYAWGWARARHLIFPLSMMCFLIPLPNLEQATTQLALIATKLAHVMGGWLGIHTVLAGNTVYDPHGNWGNWSIDEGCSGIRSIVALTLVTYVYGMLVHKKWSERFVIFAACIPVAIIANAIRVTSILVVARLSVDFAKSTWHDYSGFLTFFAALGLLMLVSTVLRHGVKALRPRVKVSRRGGPPPVAGSPSPDAPAPSPDAY